MDKWLLLFLVLLPFIVFGIVFGLVKALAARDQTDRRFDQ